MALSVSDNENGSGSPEALEAICKPSPSDVWQAAIFKVHPISHFVRSKNLLRYLLFVSPGFIKRVFTSESCLMPVVRRLRAIFLFLGRRRRTTGHARFASH